MEFSETFNELPKALEDLEWAQDIELVQINMGADTEKIKEMYNIDGKKIKSAKFFPKSKKMRVDP